MLFSHFPLTLLDFWNLCSYLLTAVTSLLQKKGNVFIYNSHFLACDTADPGWPRSLNLFVFDFQSVFLSLSCGLLTHSPSSGWLYSQEYCLLISFSLPIIFGIENHFHNFSNQVCINDIGIYFKYIYIYTVIFSPKTLSCLTYFYDGLWWPPVSLYSLVSLNLYQSL